MAVSNVSLRFACPQCGGNIKIPSGQAGQKCVCPKCDAEILAPEGPDGVAQNLVPTRLADDDFFDVGSLDSPPVSASKTKPPKASSAQETPASEPAPAKPQASQATQPKERFAFSCPLCKSPIEARREQIGQGVTCEDCHSLVVVKSPENWDEAAISSDGDNFRLSEPVQRPQKAEDYRKLAERSEFSTPADQPSTQPRGETPAANDDLFANNAKSLLEKAEQEHEEKQVDSPPLPEDPFSTRLLQFLAHPSMLARWVLFSLAWWVVLFAWQAILSAFMSSGILQAFGVVGALVAIVPTLYLLLLTAASSLTITQETFQGRDWLEGWPSWSFTEWMGEAFPPLMGLCYSFAPGFLVGTMFSCVGLPTSLGLIPASISGACLFPPIYLSMLIEGSVFTLYSKTVWGSFPERRRLWKRFYVRSLVIAAVMLPTAFLAISGWSTLLQAPAVLIAGLGVAIYFRLLGRLAWALSEEPSEEELAEQQGSKAAEESAT